MSLNELTNEEKNSCFKLLDDYVRTKHECFVAELDYATQSDNYSVCFRPLGGTADDPNRYACKYLQFDDVEMREMTSKGAVPPQVGNKLDLVLPILRQP